ncbi:hypothetical protein CC117_09825 [Parafrankia colletiae]|uniref:NADPH-dependent reductive aminase-like C-terminal domain-containing protein n=1 Tax=Parafrankia colletiae TaxID=573497 RepID=A0A1S1RJM2_9ACTN|nr:hypothetical protein CC117_09825 [Parafrankia colletiae]
MAGMNHVRHAASVRGLDTTVLDAALVVARRAVDAGYGPDGFSRLGEILGMTERADRSRC